MSNADDLPKLPSLRVSDIEKWRRMHHTGELIFSADEMYAYARQAIAAYKADALRYRKLRSHNWFDGPDTWIVTQAKAVQLGYDCPSTDRLDSELDAAIAAS